MKKSTFLAALLCACILSFNALGQDVKPFRIGVKAGLNIADVSNEVTSGNVTYSVSTDPVAGLKLGLVGDARLTRSLFINTGLLYSQKGTKFKEGAKLRINYLEIPVNMAYKWHFPALKLYVDAGPYVGIGLKAKAKSGGVSVDWDFGDGEEEISQIDFGLNVGTGVEIKKFQFGVNAGFGLTNMSNFDNEDMYNVVVSLTAGYFLW